MRFTIAIFFSTLLKLTYAQGGVKEEIIQFYRIDGNDTVKYEIQTSVFNERGRLLELELRSLEYDYSYLLKTDRGLRDWYIIETNSAGRDSTTHTYNENNQLVFQEVYRNNVLYQKKIISNGHDSLMIETYYRNGKGYFHIVERQIYLDHPDSLSSTRVSYDLNVEPNKKEQVDYVYDQQGNTLSVKTFNQSGDLVNTMIYKYNNGLVVEEIEISANGMESSIQFDYEYYDQDSTSWKTKKAFIESPTTKERLLIAFETREVF